MEVKSMNIIEEKAINLIKGKSIKNKLETKGITVIGVYRNAKEDKFDKKCDVGEETDVKNLVNDVINEYS